MEDYIVSARKYRPMTFDSVVGQKALVTTLKNAVTSGKLAHAYLFCGPRGIGKTTCARIFAKAINCMNPTEDGEACNECESCTAFNEQRSYNIFELDAASNNSVENIKNLMEQTRIPPQVGKYKVFIIDEVHMLSTAAFNAFLKTLEEPPAHVIFILATTEKHKILPTIISRCQIYDFERMSVNDIVNHLQMVAEKEGVAYEKEALDLIAEKADGGMRDALSIFDQTASFCRGDITYEKVIQDLNVLDSDNYFKITDLALSNRASDIMVLTNNIISKGFDPANLTNGLASHIRNVLMAKDDQTLSLLEASQKQKSKYQEQGKKCPVKFLYKALKILNQCDVNYKQSSNKRLLVEISLIQIAQITQADDDSPGVGHCPNRLKSLFQKNIVVQPKPANQVAGVEPTPLQTQKANQNKNEEEKRNIPTPKTPKGKLKISNLSTTFSSLKQAKQKKEVEEIKEEKTYKDQKLFTQDELELEWMAMCNRMPQTYIGLAARMKNIIPKVIEDQKVEILVDNKILLDQMEGIKRKILATLAQGLHNMNITLSFRLAKDNELTKILTKKELYEDLESKNPALKLLRNEFGLEFA